MCGCISFHVVICECICLCQSCLMPADLVCLLVCEYYLLFVNFLCLLSSLLLCLCHSLWVLFILFTNCWSLSLALSLLARMWVLPLIFPTHCLLTTFLLCLCSPGSECHLLFVLFCCLLTSHSFSAYRMWVPSLVHLLPADLSTTCCQLVSATTYSSYSLPNLPHCQVVSACCLLYSLPDDISPAISLPISLWVWPLFCSVCVSAS